MSSIPTIVVYGLREALRRKVFAVVLLLTAGFLSLIAGLIAGVYPAWRVCSVPPAMQLKVQ